MKERPMLMSAPMVRAILSGTKTQTRRVVNGFALEWLTMQNGFNAEFVALPENRACPYGYTGDRLWVREAWHTSRKYDEIPPRDIPNTATVEYDADDYRGLNGRGRPSIHMPRWASRILLEIVSVRVERLQDISDHDALAEGVSPDMGLRWQSGDDTPRGMYGELWESINGPGSWDANPWVWCISFRRID